MTFLEAHPPDDWANELELDAGPGCEIAQFVNSSSEMGGGT